MINDGPGAMDREELYRFLMDEPRFASLASLRKDGSPFVVPLGYIYDGTYIYFTIAPSRGGVKRMRNDPRVCVSVYTTDFPVTFVTIPGVAEEIDDPDHAISLAIHRRTKKSHAVDEEAYEQAWLSTGKVVFRIEVGDYAALDLNKVTDLVDQGAMTAKERATKGSVG